MKQLILLFFISMLMLLSCVKESAPNIQEVENNSISVDFRDSLIGNFNTLKLATHQKFDPTGDQYNLTVETENYPIIVSKLGVDGLRLRFGAIPDTFSRDYVWVSNNHWEWNPPWYGFDLFFINKDSLVCKHGTSPNTTKWYGNKIQ